MNLKYHIEYRHEGKGLRCEHCDFKSMFNVDLQKHIESKHSELVKIEKNLLCDQCDFATNVKVGI